MQRIAGILPLALLLCISTKVTQAQLCEPGPDNSYYPMEVTTPRVYFYLQGYYREAYLGKTTIQEREWDMITQEYSNGLLDTVYFQREGSNIITMDSTDQEIFIRCPLEPIPGQSWRSEKMNYTYTVLDTTSSLSTPFCDYTHLMQIQHRIYIGGDSITFRYFYKKGIGYVGMLDDQGILSSFLVPDTVLATRPARKSFCDAADYDEAMACTYRFLFSTVAEKLSDNSKVFEKELKSADPSIALIVLMDFDSSGRIQGLTPLQSNKVMRKTEKKILAYLQDAGTYLPAENANGEPQQFYMLMYFSYQ